MRRRKRLLLSLAVGGALALAGCDDQSKSDNADSTPIEVHCAAQGKMLTSTTVKVDCPPQ